MTARREPGQEWVCPTTAATCHSNLSDIDRDATGPIAIQHHGEKELVLDPSGHATKVAGSLAAAGIISPPSMPVFPVMKGVAYGANLRAFDLSNFNDERLNAAGGVGGPKVFLSNHSWGTIVGWGFRQSLTLSNGTVVNNVWTWSGHLDFPESALHGTYLGDQALSVGCTQIDHFHTQAPRHLMVFAAGNDRLEGPGTAGVTYYTVNNNVGTAVTSGSTNFARDWEDGDEGGFDTVEAPGTSKNCLTVGSCVDVSLVVNATTRNFGFSPGAVVTPESTSGAGPTDDGRIKPDLVAVGAGDPLLRGSLGLLTGLQAWRMVSPTIGANNTSATVQWSGTSAACPQVTGALALLTQRRKLLYPNLTDADALQGSTLKTLAIDGVDDVDAPGPDYSRGYGLMNARASVERLNQDQALGRGSLVKEFSLAVGQSVSWVTNSNSGAALQTCTLAWSDPKGPGSSDTVDPQDTRLVNNINLQVQHLETGTIFDPWTLNPDLTNKTAANRSAIAVRAVDQRNNVERVTIPIPASGRYRITVTHAGQPAGVASNHPAASAQVVSLVLSGTTPELPEITSLVPSATANQWLLNFKADPGAVFTIQTSPNLLTWTDSATVLATSDSNSAVVTSTGGDKQYWRLRRGP